MEVKKWLIQSMILVSAAGLVKANVPQKRFRRAIQNTRSILIPVSIAAHVWMYVPQMQ